MANSGSSIFTQFNRKLYVTCGYPFDRQAQLRKKLKYIICMKDEGNNWLLWHYGLITQSVPINDVINNSKKRRKRKYMGQESQQID